MGVRMKFEPRPCEVCGKPAITCTVLGSIIEYLDGSKPPKVVSHGTGIRYRCGDHMNDGKIKIHCHNCDELHEFDLDNPQCDGVLVSPFFSYTCKITGTFMSHQPLPELHRLKDGTFTDPEQSYRFGDLW